MSVPSRYDREEREVEFARALAFSDGVFAFAITLLVTTIDVPDLGDDPTEQAVVDALVDRLGSFGTFFLSFAVIGLLWINHHRLLARVRGLTMTAMWLNLLALAFVVLLPFSTELLGRYGDEPGAVAVYALNLAICAASYTLLWGYCARNDLLVEPLTRRQLRQELVIRAWITVGFLASIPIAFLVDTGVAELSWLATSLTQRWLIARWLPDDEP
ncbi:MAG: DUF1211 domain-containing protein [Solirubrobacteraceae bacterium]|nr:DUF1211 domain-containing protein [Solirubrobacteraceae bacterium]